MIEALAFDDVLLVPVYSKASSRLNVDVSTKVGKDVLKIPFISSPMDTVTELEMAWSLGKRGGMGIIHRFCDPMEQVIYAREIKRRIYGRGDNPDDSLYNGYIQDPLVSLAVGVGSSGKERATILYGELGDNIDTITIDIANGHSVLMEEIVPYVRNLMPNVSIIAGNVATGEGYKFLSELGADAVRLGIGGGCHSRETKILMGNGAYKNINKIIPGEKVINKFGNPVMVKKVINNGYKKVVKLRTTAWGSDIYVTPEHEYWQADFSGLKHINKLSKRKIIDKGRADGQNRVRWMPVTIDERTTLLTPKKILFDLPESIRIDFGAFIKREKISKLKNMSVESGYGLGYLFGLFLGDGHALLAHNGKSEIGRVSIYLNRYEGHIADKVSDIVKELFNLEVKRKIVRNCLHLYIYSNPLAHFFAQFGKKAEKHLPQKYFAADSDYTKGLYDGLIDSDGHTEKNGRDTPENTSEKIIELFNFCCFVLGIAFYNPYRKSRVGGLKNVNPGNLLPIHIGRTYTSNRGSKDYFYAERINIEECPIEVEVWDIEVDCPSHSYIANNVIVHNSICKTRVQTGFGVPSFYSVIDAKRVKQEYNLSASIIVDGGIRYPADVVKSIAAGADAAICGSIFAGTKEAPGDTILDEHGKAWKVYYGMASEEIQIKKRGGLKPGTCAEGVSTLVEYKGSLKRVLNNFVGGLRSGLTYGNARNLEELRENAEFIKITQSGISESHADGTRR